MTQRIRLGDLLVQAELVTPQHIDEALARQKETGRRLGETLIELGHISEQEVAQVLSSQLSVPWANLRHIDFSRELLNLVSPAQAEAWALIPVYVRRVRKGGDTLFVAMDDPLNDRALAELQATVKMPVQPMVASATELRSAIRAYYGRELPAPVPTPKPKLKTIVPSIAPVEIDLDELGLAPASIPAAAPLPKRPTKLPTKAPSKRPRPKRKAGARMVRLTLLDGTSIALPAPRSPEEDEAPAADEQLTTRDLVRALMLRARGDDVSDVLGATSWEPLLAALLFLLVKKGLVADWEFVEAWQRARAGRPA